MLNLVFVPVPSHSVPVTNLCIELHASRQLKIWKVDINYHVKSGAPSLQIEWVMINFVFFSAFFLLLKLNFFAEGKYELPRKIWCFLLENWVSSDQFYNLEAILFLAAIFFNWFFCGGSIWTTVQNMELLAWKLSELWSVLWFGGHFAFWRPFGFEKWAIFKRLIWTTM